MGGSGGVRLLTNAAGDEEDEEGVHDGEDGGGYRCEDVLEGAKPAEYADDLRGEGRGEAKGMGVARARKEGKKERAGCSLFSSSIHRSMHLPTPIHACTHPFNTPAGFIITNSNPLP
jgi:hypothetical protein